MKSLKKRFTTLFIGLCLTVAAGCGSPSDKLIGSWRLDNAAMKDAVGAMSEAAGPLAAIGQSFVEGILDSLDVACDFQPSGAYNLRVKMTGIDVDNAGTWSFVRAEGDKLVVSVTIGQGAPREQTITFIDRDTIQMSVPADAGMKVSIPPKATFRRVTP